MNDQLKKIKTWFTKKSNILTIALLIFILWRQGPIFLSNFKKEGLILESQEYFLIQNNDNTSKIVFPPKDTRAITIFWATWCGPCKVEMQRLKTSVEKGRIPKNSIYAINPFESYQVVRKFIANNKYPFVFIDAPDLGSELDIQSTPTTLFLENGVVKSISSGMSIIGIWKAEFFL